MDKRFIKWLRTQNLMFWLFAGFLAVLSIGIILMPFGSIYREETMLILYLSGATFWIGVIGTVFMAFRINRSRKNNSQYQKQYGEETHRLGLIRFFQNKEAIVADTVMIVSLLGHLVARVFSDQLIIMFVFWAIFVFAFGMHCMFNGVNYRYLKYTMRRDEE